MKEGKAGEMPSGEMKEGKAGEMPSGEMNQDKAEGSAYGEMNQDKAEGSAYGEMNQDKAEGSAYGEMNQGKAGEMPSGEMKEGKAGEMPSGEMNQGKAEGSAYVSTTPGTKSSKPETGQGYISGNTFDWKPVVYSIVDGMAIFEGDIVLGTVEEMQRIKTLSDLPEAAVVISEHRFRWPNALVPFDINPSLPNQQRITDAMRHIENNTIVRFVRRTPANASQFPDFVFFEDQGACWSRVGRQGGRQIISLTAGCLTGNTIHEICHTLGIWHEQSREDRDTFIRILYENIITDQRHNFNQHISDGDDVGEYDYCSIMHYPTHAFSSNGQPTIQVLQPSRPCGTAIGQRNGLSAGDIAAISYMYPHPGWSSLAGVLASNVSVGNNQDGRIEVFVKGTDSAVHHKWQTSPNNGWIADWYSLGGVIIGDPVVGSNQDGRLEVFVRGTDSAVYHKWQTSPNGAWIADWYSLNGVITGNVSVGNNLDGRLEVFVRGTDNAVYHKWQTSPNGAWIADWYSLGGVITSDIAVRNNQDGRLEIFVKGTDNAVYHKWQTSPNGAWIADWYSLGAEIALNPAIGSNADGRLEIFVIANRDHALLHKWQTAPNNGWST